MASRASLGKFFDFGKPSPCYLAGVYIVHVLQDRAQKWFGQRTQKMSSVMHYYPVHQPQSYPASVANYNNVSSQILWKTSPRRFINSSSL